MDDRYNIFELIIAAVRDELEEQELERFGREFRLLQADEAKARRDKKTADIRQIARLQTELAQFEFTYKRLVKKHGTVIPALESYLAEIRKLIRLLTLEKNM